MIYTYTIKLKASLKKHKLFIDKLINAQIGAGIYPESTLAFKLKRKKK